MDTKVTAITSEQNTILSIVHSMWKHRCLGLIVGLKIPELLCNTEESSVSIEDIAKRTGCASSKQLYTVMIVLAQWGIGKELKNKHFAKNQVMEELRRDKGPTLGHIVEFHCSEEHHSAMKSMAACVKLGQPAFVLEHGMNHCDYMNEQEKCPYDKAKMFQGSSEHPIGSNGRRQEFAENYQSAMEVYMQLNVLPDSQDVNTVYRAIPWSSYHKLVDMGGCSGHFLASILKLPGCEHTQGYVIDLPNTIEEAQKNVHKLGVPENRIEFIKHDFTKPFPSDIQLQADVIVFKVVISMYITDHDKMVKIFQNCRSLFSKHGGKLLIIDICCPNAGDMEHNVGVNGLQMGLQSIHWLSICGSGLPTLEEWVKHLQEIAIKSGYQLEQVHDTFDGGLKIFELSCK